VNILTKEGAAKRKVEKAAL